MSYFFQSKWVLCKTELFYLKTKTPVDVWVHNTALTVFWRLILLLFQAFDHPLLFFSPGKTSSFHKYSPSVIEMETTGFKISLVRICFVIKNKLFFFLFLIYPLFMLLLYFSPFLLLIFRFLSPLLSERQYSLFFWASGHNFCPF